MEKLNIIKKLNIFLILIVLLPMALALETDKGILLPPSQPRFGFLQSLMAVAPETEPITGAYCDADADSNTIFTSTADTMGVGNYCGNTAMIWLFSCNNDDCSSYYQVGKKFKVNGNPAFYSGLGIGNKYKYFCYNCQTQQNIGCYNPSGINQQYMCTFGYVFQCNNGWETQGICGSGEYSGTNDCAYGNTIVKDTNAGICKSSTTSNPCSSSPDGSFRCLNDKIEQCDNGNWQSYKLCSEYGSNFKCAYSSDIATSEIGNLCSIPIDCTGKTCGCGNLPNCPTETCNICCSNGQYTLGLNEKTQLIFKEVTYKITQQECLNKGYKIVDNSKCSGLTCGEGIIDNKTTTVEETKKELEKTEPIATQLSLTEDDLEKVTSAIIVKSICALDENCLPYTDLEGNTDYTVKCRSTPLIKEKIGTAVNKECSQSVFNKISLFSAIGTAVCPLLFVIPEPVISKGAGILCLKIAGATIASVAGGSYALETGCTINKEAKGDGLCIATEKKETSNFFESIGKFINKQYDTGADDKTVGIAATIIIIGFVSFLLFK